MLDDLKAFGGDVAMLPERFTKTVDYAVWSEHKEVVELFLRCQTQWRVSAISYVGLDYGAVLGMMDLYNVSSRQQVMADLQIMEQHAKGLINAALQKQMGTK